MASSTLLVGLFRGTMEADKNTRKQSEEGLRQAEADPAFAIHLLQVVSSPAAPAEVQQAASVYLKNYVKNRWVVDENTDVQPAGISQNERDELKARIIPALLAAPPRTRRQLTEALAEIAAAEFPGRWAQLLPEIKQGLEAKDLATLHGVLEVANAVLKRFRGRTLDKQLSDELAYCQQLVQPLLAVLKALGDQARGGGPQGGAAELGTLAACVRLLCRIFFSLNSPGLTEEFEAALGGWMAEFLFWLGHESAALGASTDPEQPAPLDRVKAAVCENLNLFLALNEEEFAAYLEAFLKAVWTQLLGVTLRPGQDHFALQAIRFLTTVARSTHTSIYSDPSVLSQLCERIVIPNLMLSAEAAELFEADWVEYVRRDTEGSDADTRRRAATDLVKVLAARSPQVTELFTGYVRQLLDKYQARPREEWRAKDCAIYFMVATTVRGKATEAKGAAHTSGTDVASFFAAQIAPLLADAAVDKDPILKADAVKFLTTFRSQLSKETLFAAFGPLLSLLRSESNVVHSYAAVAIERLLVMREGGQPRFSPRELEPLLLPLLEALFGAFDHPESQENEYLMKCVMRVIAFWGPQVVPHAAVALRKLAAQLLAAAQNPTQPGFNHFLFEAVAALLRAAAASGRPDALRALEGALFPAFTAILQQDVQEFHPYVFQIFAQLVEAQPAGPLGDTYMALLPPFLAPANWERPGNVPGLVRLLQAYLAKAPAQLRPHLQGILGVFQKLIASKASDHEGFYVLEAVVARCPPDAWEAQLPQVFHLLFMRLQHSSTEKFEKGFVLFVSRLVTQHGAPPLKAATDAVQPGVFASGVLPAVWLRTLPRLRAAAERTAAALGTAKLLAEYPDLQVASAEGLCRQLLAALVTALDAGATPQGAGGGDDDGDEEEDFAAMGYTAVFAKLHNAAPAAAAAPGPPPDPRPPVAALLRSIPSARQGPLVAELSPEQREVFTRLLQVQG